MCVAVAILLLQGQGTQVSREASGRFGVNPCTHARCGSVGTRRPSTQQHSRHPVDSAGCSKTRHGWRSWGGTSHVSEMQARSASCGGSARQSHGSAPVDGATLVEQRPAQLQSAFMCVSSNAAECSSDACARCSESPQQDLEGCNQGVMGPTKEAVRQALARVCHCYPAARPTRANLKQVYQFARGAMGGTSLTLDR